MTSATRFVGGNLVRALLREDVGVRALIRSEGHHPVDCAKAISEPGLPRSPVAGALERSVRWFTGHGYA